jgi:hypothetical protein
MSKSPRNVILPPIQLRLSLFHLRHWSLHNLVLGSLLVDVSRGGVLGLVELVTDGVLASLEAVVAKSVRGPWE